MYHADFVSGQPIKDGDATKVADRTLLLKPLLQIKQLDAALTLLGRFWSPSMYLGDWRCDEAHAFYLANLSEKATRSE